MLLRQGERKNERKERERKIMEKEKRKRWKENIIKL